MPRALLVSMPYADPSFASLQLGILKAVLAKSGIEAGVRNLNLRFVDYLERKHPASSQFARRVVPGRHFRGAGDWSFRLPSLFAGDCAAADDAYLRWLVGRGMDASEVEQLAALRAHVSGFLDETADQLLAERPKVVGFTLMFSQTVPSAALARVLKQRDPGVRIVVGGASCTGPMGAAIARLFPWIDVVVRGPGETVAPPLFAALLAGEEAPELPGVCRRAGGRLLVDDGHPHEPVMDEIPTPDFDEYFADLDAVSPELRGPVTIPFEGARGCWWGERSHCTFCGLNGDQMRFRSKSSARLYDELVALARRHRVNHFFAVDNILALEHVRELLPRLRDSGFDFDFFYEIKPSLNREQLQLLRDAGVRCVQPGIESLSSAVLKQMDKGSSALQNIRFLKWCTELEIDPIWNLLYGFPGEPVTEYANMAALVPSLVHLRPPVKTYPVQVHRFSPMFTQPEAHGLRLIGPFRHYRFLFPDADEATVSDVAYLFEFEPLVSQPPGYADALVAATDEWRRRWREGTRPQLTSWSGPSHVRIVDGRRAGESRSYLLEGTPASLYRACEAGASARALASQHQLDERSVHAALAPLVADGLLYEEAGRYLALALPAQPRRAAAPPLRDEPTLVTLGRAP